MGHDKLDETFPDCLKERPSHPRCHALFVKHYDSKMAEDFR